MIRPRVSVRSSALGRYTCRMSSIERPKFRWRDAPAWCGVFLGRTLARLPWSLQRRLGSLLGGLLYVCARGRRGVAARNLELCFPELDAASRADLLRRHFRELGIGLFEFMRAWWGDIESLRTHVELDGLERLRALQSQGRGVLLVSGHFMTLEICGRLLCDHVPLAGMYRPHATPPMEWAVKSGRLRYAAAMFSRDALRAAVRHLKQGGLLWYAPDQDMLGKDSVFVSFFGIPASTITATHQLARLSGAAVVPFFHRREGDRYILRIGPALEPFPTNDVAADTAMVNVQIEQMVREAPTQYLWVHKRFKRRPEPGAASLYAERPAG